MQWCNLVSQMLYQIARSIFFFQNCSSLKFFMNCSCVQLHTTVQIDIARDLRGILIRIERFKSLELHYTKVHLKHIKQLWEDFESRQHASKAANEKNELERLSSNNEFQSNLPSISFFSWLPSFYDELLLYLEQEWKW